MENRIQQQATKVWQAASEPGVIGAYTQALTLTWNLIKEVAILVWLVLCLVLVAGDWLWINGKAAISNLQTWFSRMKEVETTEVASDAGKVLANVSKQGATAIVSYAKTQLGLQEERDTEPEPGVVQPLSGLPLPKE